jgi:spore coat polysaccharide biosynthesis predicted glycosyltransferase SpsG
LHRLILCCDANVQSGLGHFTRCFDLALALQAQQPAWQLAFLGDYSEHARDTLSRAALGVLPAAANSFSIADLRARLTPDDVVVVDSYLAGQPLHDFLNERGTRWAAFDDLGAHEYAGAQLVINSRIHAGQLFRYRSARAALGPRFMPLPAELSRLRQAREALVLGPEVQSILIFVGGTDLYAVGEDLARAASEVFSRASIQWIMSGAAPERPLPRNVTCLPLQPSLTPLLASADLLLSGGGRLKYEAGFALVPNAALSQTPLQAADTAILAEVGVTWDLGQASHFDALTLARRLAPLAQLEIRTQMSEQQRAQFPSHENQPLLAMLREALGPR